MPVGVGVYRAECQAVADKGYEGFVTGGPGGAAQAATATGAANAVSQ